MSLDSIEFEIYPSQSIMRSDVSSNSKPKIYCHPQPMMRSDVSFDSKPKIYLAQPMRRSDVSFDSNPKIYHP